MYDLRTSGGFSGPIRHFRTIEGSATYTFCVGYGYRGSNPRRGATFIFSNLAVFVYESCTSAVLASDRYRVLWLLRTTLIPVQLAHGIDSGLEAGDRMPAEPPLTCRPTNRLGAESLLRLEQTTARTGLD